jgi:hypothetical protein
LRRGLSGDLLDEYSQALATGGIWRHRTIVP